MTFFKTMALLLIAPCFTSSMALYADEPVVSFKEKPGKVEIVINLGSSPGDVNYVRSLGTVVLPSNTPTIPPPTRGGSPLVAANGNRTDEYSKSPKSKIAKKCDRRGLTKSRFNNDCRCVVFAGFCDCC